MFDAQVNADAKAHALRVFPEESCGLVVGNSYVACDNVADDPKKNFRVAEAVYRPYVLAGTLQGVIHSHPFEHLRERSSPSADDMRSQVSMAVPYGIVDTDGAVVNDPYWWGDFRLDLKMIGHEFHHGVEDCFLPVRRYFWQRRRVKLADVPRDPFWWREQESLYLEGFERMGFRRIAVGELRDGDVILGKINSKVVNHAAVYLDNEVDGKGLLYHHLPGRLSRREPVGPWLKKADMAVRYRDAD